MAFMSLNIGLTDNKGRYTRMHEEFYNCMKTLFKVSILRHKLTKYNKISQKECLLQYEKFINRNKKPVSLNL
jgi:hypothetical protein